MNTNIIEHYYCNQSVIITLTSKNQEIVGLILDPVRNREDKITHWRFIPNKRVGKFTDTHDESLVEHIPHEEIKYIDYIIKS